MDYTFDKKSDQFKKYKEKFDNLFDQMLHGEVEWEIISISRPADRNTFVCKVGIGRAYGSFERKPAFVALFEVPYEDLHHFGAKPREIEQTGDMQ